ncbi:MAG TPA: signal peptidase II [Burkholderiales bacterium]|jgi:signal peptidase II|nr:signal peptidase II [Burkholderiales bacterium]
MPSAARWFTLSALIVVLDQASKYVAVRALAPGSPLEVLPFLALWLTYNPGAAFSFLADADGWQRWFFVAVAIIASGVIAYLIVKNRGDALLCLALSLVLGGAIGNLIDRLLRGAVVDFVLLHWRGWHWPAFNLADSCITVGVVVMIWDSLRRSRVKQVSARRP